MPSSFLMEQVQAISELRTCNSLLASSLAQKSADDELQTVKARHQGNLADAKAFYAEELQMAKVDEIEPLRLKVQSLTTGSEEKELTISKLEAGNVALASKYKEQIANMKVLHSQQLYVAKKL